MMFSTKGILLALPIILMLTACGGGGGGGSGDDPDTTSPTLVKVTQVNANRNKVIAVFNEPMDGATINTSTFWLEDKGGAPVTGVVSYSGLTATFAPNIQLAPSASYTATITTGVKDTSGNSLASDVRWMFTTASGSIQISWDANLETAVNRPGGGYWIYYSANSGFSPGDGGVTEIDVPYSSGPSTPTSILIPLNPGIYFLRIAAYSAINSPGSGVGSISTVSPQIMLFAP